MAKPINITRCMKLWATETGGEQMARLGYAAMDVIRGQAAANDADYSAPAVRFNAIIEQLIAAGMDKEYRVLRMHYLAPGLPEPDKLARLAREGMPISRAAYHIYLDRAHCYFAGALDFGDPACES